MYVCEAMNVSFLSDKMSYLTQNRNQSMNFI